LKRRRGEEVVKVGQSRGEKKREGRREKKKEEEMREQERKEEEDVIYHSMTDNVSYHYIPIYLQIIETILSFF
jgi:hypothetical protein